MTKAATSTLTHFLLFLLCAANLNFIKTRFSKVEFVLVGSITNTTILEDAEVKKKLKTNN